jgi:hypothetical protein
MTTKDSETIELSPSVEFPPLPCSVDFKHTIIRDACR